MARKKAPTKSTGGGGFGFEDKVAAYYALHLLAATRLFGADFGRIVRIDYQARDSGQLLDDGGWLLDDLVVTFEDAQGSRHAAHSVKSDRQVTTRGFPSDFVNDVWEHWLRRAPSPFQVGRDRLVLVVGELSDSVSTAWSGLVAQARATSPDRLVARFTQKGQSSALQRRLFSSLACPINLRAGSKTDDAATAKLVGHLDLLAFDFERESSRNWAEMISVAQGILESSNGRQANLLLESLCRLASMLRPKGGFHTLPSLLEHIRGQFLLRPYPDFQSDWTLLESRTTSAIGRVRSVIGRNGAINRSSLRANASKAIATSPVVVLYGESGCGKSALAKDLAVEVEHRSRCIWLNINDLEGTDLQAMSGTIGLHYRLDQVLTASPSQRTFVVFDALDRASASAIRNVCELVGLLASANALGTFRIIITSEPSGWSRIQKELARTLPKDFEAKTCPVGTLEATDVYFILSGVSALRSVANRAEICSLLQNAKILDWVVSAVEHGQTTDPFAWVGMTQVMDWVWEYWVGVDSDSIARSALLQKLGAADGDSLSSGLPLYGSVDQLEAQALGTDVIRRLVRVDHERCYFLHDLAADWARLRVILGRHDDVLMLIVEKSLLPRWHKAIRYFGQRLLEATPKDPTGWQQMLNRLADMNPPSFGHDLLLESVIFATNSSVLLEQIWPVLVANDGHLLRRFLRLFLHSATIPDPRFVGMASSPSEASELSSMMRWPYGPYWLSFLGVLRRHQDDVATHSMAMAAKVCKTWLETVPLKTDDGRPFPGRRDAAELVLRLAQELQFHKALGAFFEDDVDETVYEAFLFGARDIPEEVSSLALEFSQRRPWNKTILDRANAIKEERHRNAARELLADPKRLAQRAAVPSLGSVLPQGPLRKAWLQGPGRRVDDAFQKVCHGKSTAFQQLIAAAPLAAREVALAVCIEEPRHEEHFGWDSVIHDQCGLAHWSGTYPPSFFGGCFLTFLRANPDVGLDLIITLVDFATERWIEASLRFQGVKEDVPESALGPSVLLENGSSRWLLGDGRAYGWYRLGGLNNEPITCALMALEKWLYDECDAGRDVSSWVQIILEKGRSVAFTGVLVALGMKYNKLYLGCLRPLLSIWPVYNWQDQLVMNGDVWRIERTGWVRFGEKVFRAYPKTSLTFVRIYQLCSNSRDSNWTG